MSLCGFLTIGLTQSASAATAAASVSQSDTSQNDSETETDMPLLANKDMTLDLAEVKTAASAHFDKLNQDGDSTLEAAEVKGVIGTKLFNLADPDHDGTISKDEYLAACLTYPREPRWQGEGADARRTAPAVVGSTGKPCNAADAPLLANPKGQGRFPLTRRCRLLVGAHPTRRLRLD
jgi:hypothetical protein